MARDTRGGPGRQHLWTHGIGAVDLVSPAELPLVSLLPCCSRCQNHSHGLAQPGCGTRREPETGGAGTKRGTRAAGSSASAQRRSGRLREGAVTAPCLSFPASPEFKARQGGDVSSLQGLARRGCSWSWSGCAAPCWACRTSSTSWTARRAMGTAATHTPGPHEVGATRSLRQDTPSCPLGGAGAAP